MRLPPDTIIDRNKLAGYLLRWRREDDKSTFLALAGYTLDNPERLMRDIREQVLPLDAQLVEETEYGPKFRIRGTLTGPNGRALLVVTIWMREDATNLTKFVTLFPDK
jgi:uncharacterized protein DUF6883